MRRRIPLNAVRAFEAAARHQSLVRAADELCVTPTAVSHQIRLLEDFLQLKLFLRKNSRLELTPESRQCLEQLTEALDTIDDALNVLRKPTERRSRLGVGASASVASLWLLPRLQGFVQQAPEVDVSVTTFIERQTIESQSPDLWICNWQTDLDRRIEPLLEEEIIPVCSPALAERFGELSFDSLRELPLIHVDRGKPDPNGQYPTWERYLREAGINRKDVTKGPRFNQAGPAVDAAKAGFGALLGRSILIEDALLKGDLVQIGEAYPVRNKYYLVSGWRTASSAVDQFRDWLFDQVHTSALHAQIPVHSHIHVTQ
jgi:LysR family transcriptional regulator, glycine cleavage system transcriptional activator